MRNDETPVFEPHVVSDEIGRRSHRLHPKRLSLNLPATSPAIGSLHSWKEIASYLKCDVRTGQRWEKNEGLPIHRHMHNKLSSIYAHAREIDEWRARRCPSSVEKVRMSRAGLTDGRLRLAVLPFENLTSHPGQASFSDGLTVETITQLVHLLPQRVAVIAWATARVHGPTSEDASRLQHNRHLSYLLAGSVRRDCHRVHITVQLIEVGDETHVWAKTYRGDIADELGIQIVAARRIAHSLRAILIAQGERASS
jgi:TolB-like protein